MRIEHLNATVYKLSFNLFNMAPADVYDVSVCVDVCLLWRVCHWPFNGAAGRGIDSFEDL